MPTRTRTKIKSELYELRVTTLAELSCEVAEFLVNHGAGGVIEEDVGGRVRLITYGEQRALEGLRATISGVAGRRAKVDVRKANAALDGWDTAWMKHLEPVEISKTLVISPTNRPPPDPLDPGRARRKTVVRLEPSLAFGFGEHPTTRLAAREIERLCRADVVATLLDFGTGSGVLAIVAALSGASHVVGTDIDPEALRSANENAALNGVERVCRFSRTPLAPLRRRFELVVANVDRSTILSEARRLARSVLPGGVLLLTGFLVEDAAVVEHAFTSIGMSPTRRKHEAHRTAPEDWVLVRLRRPPSQSRGNLEPSQSQSRVSPEPVAGERRGRPGRRVTARGTRHTPRSR